MVSSSLAILPRPAAATASRLAARPRPCRRISRCAGFSVRSATSTQSLAWSSYNLILACNDTFASLNYGERTRQTVRRQHTCVRRGAASVQSRRYHKNLLCAEWAAQWCTERPPLGTPTPGQALASYPGSVSTIARLAEVGTIPMIFTAAEFGADVKLDVAALGLAMKHN